MDGKAFDQAIQRLATNLSRREIWRGMTGGTLVAAATRLPITVEAKKKRKDKTSKKLKFNAFHCINVGQACRGDDANCCSGICQGKKPKKGESDKSRCVAHNVGECLREQDICQGVPSPCGTAGVCIRTTGQGKFCGLGAKSASACAACTRDPDCEALGFGAGAACTLCVGNCVETGGTACVPAAA